MLLLIKNFLFICSFLVIFLNISYAKITEVDFQEEILGKIQSFSENEVTIADLNNPQILYTIPKKEIKTRKMISGEFASFM